MRVEERGQERESLSLVTVGHVDHGKSTLIGRLLHDSGALAAEKLEEIRKVSAQLGRQVELAYAMDHLEEERRDEMTIDTAQAFFSTVKREYVLIDAPGHQELLRNMITGTAQAEAALLVVDAADGLREQTQRHAFLISMLGIRQVAVVINKMDRVGWKQQRFDELAAAASRFLNAVEIAPLRIVPISAKEGDNVRTKSVRMPWYTGPVLIDVLDEFEPGRPAVDRSLRFPVQDVYHIDGRDVLVGRIESGCISVGHELVFLPSGARARVAEVLIFGKELDRAYAEECIGLVVDPPIQARRGEVACPPQGLPVPVTSFRANVFWIAAAPCRRGERLLIRATTQDVPGTVERIERRIDSASLAVLGSDADELCEMEVGEVRFYTERPLIVEPFGTMPQMGRIVALRGTDLAGAGLVV